MAMKISKTNREKKFKWKRRGWHAQIALKGLCRKLDLDPDVRDFIKRLGVGESHIIGYN